MLFISMIESEIPVFANNEWTSRISCNRRKLERVLRPITRNSRSGKISAGRFNFDFVALTAIPELKDAKLELVKSRIEFARNLLE
jgi:hypothetical protein